MRCGRLGPHCLGRAWIKCRAPQPTALRAHINYLRLHAACQLRSTVCLCTATMFAVFVLRASAQNEALPKAGHACSGEKCREHPENGLVARLDWQPICTTGSVALIRSSVG